MPRSRNDHRRIVELIRDFDECLERQDFDRLATVIGHVLATLADDGEDLRDPTEERAALLERAAFILGQMKQYAQASKWYLRVVAVRKAIHGADHPWVARTFDTLAEVADEYDGAQADLFRQEAARILRQHLERLQDALPALIAEPNLETALQVAEEILRVTERLEGTGAESAPALTNLAYVCKALGDLERAEKYYLQAIERWTSSRTERDPDLGLALNNLATLYQARNEHTRAELCFRRALAILTASCGAEESNFPEIVVALGQSLAQGSDLADDPRAHEAARRIDGLGRCMANFAKTLEALSKKDEAESTLRISLRILCDLNGPDHPVTLDVAAALATTLERDGRPRTAKDLLSDACGAALRHTAWKDLLTVVPALEPFFEALAGSLKQGQLPEVDEISNSRDAVAICVENFTSGRFADCFRNALRAGATTPSLELLQMFLISVQFLGGPHPHTEPSLEPIARSLLGLVAADPWTSALLQVTLGQTTGEEALRLATSAAQRAQAHFYTCWRHVVEGDVRRAEEQRRYCLSIGVDSLECRIAGRVETLPSPEARDAEGRELSTVNANVARLFRETRGAGVEAGALVAEALTLAERLPAGNASRLVALYNAALLAYWRGDYNSAENNLRQVIEEEGLVRPDPKMRSAALNALGLTLAETGHLAEAERHLHNALDVIDHNGLQHDSDTAQAIGNLAEVKREQGDAAAAAPLYARAIGIFRDLAPGSGEYARWLHNAGLFYWGLGDISEATPLLEEAMTIRRRVLPSNHPDLARNLSSLAMLEIAKGRLDAAEEQLLTAAAIERESGSRGSASLSRILSNLAHVQLLRGNHAKAAELLEEAIQTAQRQLGPEHPVLLTMWLNAAVVRATVGRWFDALEAIQRAEAAEGFLLQQVMGVASERHRLEFVGQLRRRLHAALSICLAMGPAARPVVGSVFELALKRKGLAAEAHSVIREASVGNRFPELRDHLDALRTVRSRLAALLLGEGGSAASFRSHVVEQLNRERETLEARIAGYLLHSEAPALGGAADCRTIASALPPDAVLVELVHFFRLDLTLAADPANRAAAHYVAFVVRGGESTDVHLVDLGPAHGIDDAIASFRRHIIDEPSGEAKILAAGHVVRQRLFDPLLPHLVGKERLFIAPDGDISTLPLEVLPNTTGGSLIDDFTISYLSAGRDVMHLATPRRGQASGSMVIADPDFELHADESSPVGGNNSRQSRQLDRNFYFERLSGTRQEGKAVAQLLGVAPLTGEAALESTVKAVHSPLVLHLATHGFFLSNQADIDEATFWADAEPAGRLAKLENPLLRSGLALAGANTWLRGGNVPQAAEDGLITAEDVAGLDLSNTELVVLSACETGLGEVHVGEGVLGLRRTVALAGARTLVMSLWKVPDNETAALMTAFYAGLKAGRPRAEALRGAQLAIRSQQSHPWYWGAFICQGDPGPMRLA